jgi:DNA repair protein RadC
LLYRFGSIGRIAQATDIELRAVADKGEAWIDAFLVVRRIMQDGMREELTRTPLGANRRALCAYLLASMQELQEERMIAIFADNQGFVISEETIAEGGSGHLLLTPRRIFGRAMKLDADRILLAHNHPSGNAQPSVLDITTTKALVLQARDLGLCIEDHLIVGRREVVSMKDRGLL